MNEILIEADNKNKEGFASSLRAYGEDYIRYKNQIELAKKCIKSLFDGAEDKGITKDMIVAYAQTVQLEEFNAKVLCSAVQQELFNENKEQSDNQSN